MMVSRSLDHGEGQVPHAYQTGTDFAMAGSKHLFFCLPQGNGLFARKRMKPSVNVVKVRDECHLAEVVHQSSYERLRGQLPISGLEKHQVPGNLRHMRAVLPQFLDG